MQKAWPAAMLAVFFSVTSMAAHGVIDVQSAYGVEETASRLEKILDEKGMTIFTHVDHAEDAESRVWISYNDPGYLQERHDVQGCREVLANVGKALEGITKAAAARQGGQ